MWSDNETELDALNVRHLVGAVADLVREPHLSPVTVGVYGDWGVGKSSVVRMVMASLASDPEVLCVYFNGWRFEGYEDAKTALISTILDDIKARRSLSARAKALLKSLAGRVNWLRVGRLALHVKLAALTQGASVPVSIAAEAPGFAADATRVARATRDAVAGAAARGDDPDTDDTDDTDDDPDDLELDKLVKEAGQRSSAVHRSVRDFEKEFAALLAETGLRRLVVVIDDLDRCLPDRVIETLEAIRLFLAVPGTAFVIAADEALVQHAVRLRFPQADALKLNVGRDYLEKMVQIPVRVPPLAPADIEPYLALLFAQRRLAADRFTALCARVAPPLPAPGEPVTAPAVFTAATAAAVLGPVLGTPPDAALMEDLGLAARIADVVARSVDGNPRQIKRYLNAYVLRLTLARARNVALPSRVAAKLMLLEYFRLEAFRTLARWYAAAGGAVPELAALETRALTPAANAPGGSTEGTAGAPPHADRAPAAPVADVAPGVGTPAGGRPVDPPREAGAAADAALARRARGRAASAGARSPTRPPASTVTSASTAPVPDATQEPMPLPPEAEAWLADEWLTAWLRTDPPLAGEALGPYLAFARDRLAVRGVTPQRLSPAGQEVLVSLLSPSRPVRLAAARRARDLSAPDAVAVHEALAERVRLSEEADGPASVIHGLFDLVSERPELVPEFVAFLRSLAPTALGAGTPARVLGATRRAPAADAARHLVLEWSTQAESPTLAAAARAVLAGPGALAPSGTLGVPGGPRG